MKITVKGTIFALCAAVCLSGTAASAGPLEDAVKARKSLMRLYAFNLGALGAMAKGSVDYNSDAAAAAANNLAALAKINQSAMWPQGSDNGALGDATRALPDIWSTFPAISEKGKALVVGTTNMAKVAGTDLASLQGAMGGVGGACGGCHKTFRAK